MPDVSPFLIVHGLRAEPLMVGSPKATLALAILDQADPEPVAARVFRDAFGCSPSEASHVLAKMRADGLIVRDARAGTYRLTIAADAMKARIARKLSGEDLPAVLTAATETTENHE